MNNLENEIAKKITELKKHSGSHSPSIFTLKKEIQELTIHIDACFLSNPYATDLFLQYMKKELIDTDKLRDALEFYPSQNAHIAKILADSIGIDYRHVFITNGAVEAISAILHNYVKDRIIINIPTFSSYYEFVNKGTEVIFYKLSKEANYALDIERYINFCKSIKPQSIVLINPNNPDGNYISYDNLIYLVSQLQEVDNIIIDESFIHFAFEYDSYELVSYRDLFTSFDNVVLVKSMSKDFGIAGIRAGYALMSKDRVSSLLKNGYLWNSNGLSEYFFKLYAEHHFREEYEQVRRLYIKQTQDFFNNLREIKAIKTYPSYANFALIELINGELSSDFVVKMLARYGIYTRTCADKIGLDGEFVRLASRSLKENAIILESIKDIFGEQ